MVPIPSGCAPVSTVYRQKSWDEEFVRRLRSGGGASNSSGGGGGGGGGGKCAIPESYGGCGYPQQQEKGMEMETEDGCKTPPKSRQERIPEESLVCPPAPKKPHLRRRLLPPPVSYFSSPELELFFNQLEISAK